MTKLALHIHEPIAGGLVLGYRCAARCRHCLYACGPHRRDGEPDDAAGLEAVLDSLAKRAPRARYHIGGGEPFLNPTRLTRTVTGFIDRGLSLEYVETNASWVTDTAATEAMLADLAQRGLGAVLVSLSPFHNEFVPLRKTLILIESARRVLPYGPFVWVPEFLEDLRTFPHDARLDFDALIAAKGDTYARNLAARYHLVVAGRAGRYLAAHNVRIPWRELADGSSCAERLVNTHHFHVDGQGSYVPGLCSGLVLPFDRIPGPVDLRAYPVLEALVRGGPAKLVELARDRGFTPDDHYASACDLCTHARLALYPYGFTELGPSGFYDPRSIEGFDL